MMLTIVLYASRRGLLLGLPVLALAAPAASAQVSAQAATLLDSVSVYPNPAHIRATVTVPAVTGAVRATVTLLDAQGTAVFEQPVSLSAAGGAAELPLLGRAPGLYRVQVRAGGRHAVRALKVE